MAKLDKPPVRERETFGNKAKAHQRYFTSDRQQVPGSTTILGVLDKPNLVGWANRLGLDGIDSRKFTDEAAAIGSLSHYLIECELKGDEPDTKDYTPAQMERAQFALESFHRWRERHELEPILIEGRLVSDEYRYGGTVDYYGKVDGRLELIDFKTSKALYMEHRAQTASYVNLLKEAGHRVQSARLVRVGRTEDEGFEEHVLTKTDVSIHWQLFKHCLGVYYTRRQINGGKP